MDSNSKRWMIAAVGVVMVGALWWSANAQVAGGRIHNLVVGRFDVVPASNAVTHHDGTTTTEPAVIKLDTTTGRAWKLRETVSEQGERVLSWEQIPHMNASPNEATE